MQELDENDKKLSAMFFRLTSAVSTLVMYDQNDVLPPEFIKQARYLLGRDSEGLLDVENLGASDRDLQIMRLALVVERMAAGNAIVLGQRTKDFCLKGDHAQAILDDASAARFVIPPDVALLQSEDILNLMAERFPERSYDKVEIRGLLDPVVVANDCSL